MNKSVESVEIGRELTPGELQEKKVVWLSGETDNNTFASLWVKKISSNSIRFVAAFREPPDQLLLFRRQDGTLWDDGGRRIRVYEYLGEV